MIEDIVEVSAKAGDYSLADFEVLVHSKVYSPASRTPEKVSFGDSSVVKYIGAEWRRTERTWIEHLISDLVGQRTRRCERGDHAALWRRWIQVVEEQAYRERVLPLMALLR